MKTIDFNIIDLLPEIIDKNDQCIYQLQEKLLDLKGVIDVIYDSSKTIGLSIEFNSELIQEKELKESALKLGQSLHQRYGHLILEVKGVRHQRHARSISQKLEKTRGIIKADVSSNGVIALEWDSQLTTKKIVLHELYKNSIKPIDQTEEKKDDTHHHRSFYLNFLGQNTELYLAIGSGTLWILGLTLSVFLEDKSNIPLSLYIVSSIFGGYFTAIEAFKATIKGKFEIDFLMLVAAIGAGILGKWSESALLLFLFSMGHALEHYAMNRARKSIKALSGLTPSKAILLDNGVTKEVDIKDLKLNDLILIKPNSKIAADGVVIKGNSHVNQAPITGESIPVEKSPLLNPGRELILGKIDQAHRVFTGTINGTGLLEVQVLKLSKDSTLARLITLVKEAESQKSPTQHLADKFEKYYVPIVLIVVVLLHFAFLIIDETFANSFYRAMSVLIAASPCALAISTPSAILAGIARAAKQGVLIKGGKPLEDLGEITALAFDKTGTLTEGRPKLTHAIPYGNSSEKELLTIAIAIESLSDHPLASAIVTGGKEKLGGVQIPQATDMQSLTARGVKAKINGNWAYIGNRRLFEELTGQQVPQELNSSMQNLEEQGNTAMIVYSNDQYIGIVSAMDLPRKEAKETLATLHKIGIQQSIMLTGDHQKVADAISKQLGITHPLGNLLPEDKVSSILQLKEKYHKVAMVGDGVNDAPAMATATVGIAMGAAGSDVALETADIALMADKLDNLPFAIGLSRKAKRIIKQNIWISMGMVAILVPLTIFGIAKIGPAVIAHEGSTMVVVLNALRLLWYKQEK